MKIGIAGTGRLGLCLALNLECSGYDVVCYDVNETRVNEINNKSLKTPEPFVEKILKNSKIKATTKIQLLIEECNTIFCVIQTPSLPNNKYDHSYIDNFVDNVLSLGKVENKHLIINSTTFPGYVNELNKKMKPFGWSVSYNPEFIAQGSIMMDQIRPDMVLIGSPDENCANDILSIYTKLCENKPTYCIMTPLEAEITKLSLNCFLTTKISFANMIGDICKKVSANPDVVLNAIGSDSRIGNKYLKYGFGFGGPCTKFGQLVQTSTGLKEIQNIKIGDEVFTHKGRLKKVTEVFERYYEGEMNIIQISGMNSELCLTPEHPVYMSKKTGSEKFVDIKDLQKGDYCSIPKIEMKNFNLENILLTTKFGNETIPITSDFMKFLGLYLAEGNIDQNIKNKYRICFTFHAKEVNLSKFIHDFAKSLGRIARTYPHGKNGIRVRFYHTSLAKWILETFGHGCDKKQIPTQWLGLSDNLLNALIEGIWLGDGSISNKEYILGLTSQSIHNFNILWMLKNGIAFSKQNIPSKLGKDGIWRKPVYILKVSNPYYINMLSEIFTQMKLKRENVNLRHTNWFRNSNLLCRIVNTDSMFYSGNVYNLEVEDDHSYMLDSCVVHNCFPRDNKALGTFADECGIDAQISYATDIYNEQHLHYQVENFIVERLGINPNGFFRVIPGRHKVILDEGVAYKKGTDLLTESQQLQFALKIQAIGFDVEIVDRQEILDQLNHLYPNKFKLTLRKQ